MAGAVMISAFAILLSACGGSAASSSSSDRLLASVGACYTAWNTYIVYDGGATVSYRGGSFPQPGPESRNEQ